MVAGQYHTCIAVQGLSTGVELFLLFKTVPQCFSFSFVFSIPVVGFFLIFMLAISICCEAMAITPFIVPNVFYPNYVEWKLG